MDSAGAMQQVRGVRKTKPGAVIRPGTVLQFQFLE
jgi:hypothetical protein